MNKQVAFTSAYNETAQLLNREYTSEFIKHLANSEKMTIEYIFILSQLSPRLKITSGSILHGITMALNDTLLLLRYPTHLYLRWLDIEHKLIRKIRRNQNGKQSISPNN